MKKNGLLALAAFIAVGSCSASLALADESSALVSGPEVARLLAAPANLPPISAPRVEGAAKSAPLNVGAAGSGNASALVANVSGATPIIPASSLVAGDIDLKLLSPGDLVGKGFTPIKADAAPKSAVPEDIVSRSAAAGSQLFLSPSSK